MDKAYGDFYSIDIKWELDFFNFAKKDNLTDIKY